MSDIDNEKYEDFLKMKTVAVYECGDMASGTPCNIREGEDGREICSLYYDDFCFAHPDKPIKEFIDQIERAKRMGSAFNAEGKCIV